MTASPDSVRLLGVFLAWHLLLDSLKFIELFGGAAGPLFFAWMTGWTVLVTVRRTFRIGMMGLFVAKIGPTIAALPMTSNHAFIETLLVGLVLLQSSPSGTDPRVCTRRAADLRETVLFVLMAAYAMAGVQKLGQGYWRDGEFIAFELLYGTGGFAHSLQVTFAWIAEIGRLDPVRFDPAGLDALAGHTMVLPEWAVPVILGLSWSFLAVEILVPLLVLWPRTRRYGLVLVVFVQIGIGMFAWETEFMCLALSGIALSGGRVARNLALLFALEVALAGMFGAAGVDR